MFLATHVDPTPTSVSSFGCEPMQGWSLNENAKPVARLPEDAPPADVTIMNVGPGECQKHELVRVIKGG